MRRAYAIPALCALVVLLLAVLCTAQIITIEKSFVEEGQDYPNGCTYELGNTASETNATVDFKASGNTYSGTVRGHADVVFSQMKSFTLTWLACTFNNAQVVVSGTAPPLSRFVIEGGTATLSNTITPFVFTDALTKETPVSVLLVGVAVRYKGVPRGGPVVLVSPVSKIAGQVMSSFSLQLVALDVTGAGSLLSAPVNVLTLSNNSLLSVDGCTCYDCADGLVQILDSLGVEFNSTFRISDNKAKGSTPAIMTVPQVTVTGPAVVVVANNTMTNSGGSLFRNHVNRAMSVTLSQSSQLAVYANLVPTTGLSSVFPIPGSVDAGSAVYAYRNQFGGAPMSTAADYLQHGLRVDYVLQADGTDAATNQCTMATCLAPNTVGPSSTAGDCHKCQCKPSLHSFMCTVMGDAFSVFSDSCDVSHCRRCAKDDPKLCLECDSESELTAENQCLETTCAVTDCDRCDPLDTSKCEYCRPGFYLNNAGVCGRCTNPACARCDPAAPNKCTECFNGEPPTASGHCPPPCDVPDCAICIQTDRDRCAKCNPGMTLMEETGTCGPCNVPDCLQCVPNRPDWCGLCKPDLSPTYYGTCTPGANGCRVLYCARCTATDINKCEKCLPNFHLTQDGTQCLQGSRCTDSIGCEACEPTNPDRCLSCNEGYELNPSTYQCVQCPTNQNCKRCSGANVNECLECDSGYMMTTNSQCKPCRLENCIGCSTTKANYCTTCKAPYVDNFFTGVCRPTCYVQNCAECVLGNPSHCHRCKPGYHVCIACNSYRCKANGSGVDFSAGATVASALAGVSLLYALQG